MRLPDWSTCGCVLSGVFSLIKVSFNEQFCCSFWHIKLAEKCILLKALWCLTRRKRSVHAETAKTTFLPLKIIFLFTFNFAKLNPVKHLNSNPHHSTPSHSTLWWKTVIMDQGSMCTITTLYYTVASVHLIVNYSSHFPLLHIDYTVFVLIMYGTIDVC